jgi:hypothetical protein
MLAKELTGVCHAVGLDPFLGFMHQPRYGRPALALDLMEEFRPLFADSVAISLVNRGELGPEDFIRSASGTFLNDRGRKAFWEAWFRRFDTEVSRPEFEYKMAYRRMLEVQARQLWRFVRGEAVAYHGFTTRSPARFCAVRELGIVRRRAGDFRFQIRDFAQYFLMDHGLFGTVKHSTATKLIQRHRFPVPDRTVSK